MANLGEGLSVAVLGYGMIFVILAIIMLVLIVMKLIFANKSAAQNEQVSKAAPTVAPTTAPAANNVDLASIDKEEIVAITAAALAAADQENNSKCQVRIMSVKQL